MAKLVWDLLDSRVYESGLDRGVLFIDGVGVPWSGLVSVNENPQGGNASPVMVDGQKTQNDTTGENLAVSISAYIYPDEFEACDGTAEENDVQFGEQPRKPFNLIYRTFVGTAAEGDQAAYKIHFLYGCYAAPAAQSFSSLSTNNDISALQWTASTIPQEVPGYRASAHLIVDTRLIQNPLLLEQLEDMIYGTSTSNPEMPSASDLAFWFGDWVYFRITVNGDGTWTATGPDELFAFPTGDTFAITVPTVNFLDANTYTIETYV